MSSEVTGLMDMQMTLNHAGRDLFLNAMFIHHEDGALSGQQSNGGTQLDFTTGFVPAAELAGLALGSAMSSFAVLKSVAHLAGEIYSLYKCVQANHRVCSRLAERALSLQSALSRFATKLHEAGHASERLDKDNYTSLNMQLIRVLQAMERAHDLIQSWGGAKQTFFSKLKRALISRHFHEEFNECNQQLSECLADLRGDAMLQMFVKQISLPDSSAWQGENHQDSLTDMQAIPAAIAAVAQSQNELHSSLASVHLNMHQLKSALEAHGVTAASLEKGFAQLEIKLDKIESKLDLNASNASKNFEEMKGELSKLRDLLQQSDSHSKAGKGGARTSKMRFLKDKMPHLSIAYEELRLMEEVGSGGFGTVYRGTWQGSDIAYKRIFIDSSNKKTAERQIKQLYQEAYIMSLLRNPVVCPLYGVVLEAPQYGLVLPFYSGGALDDFLRDEDMDMTQDMYLQMALSISSAMVHLHGCSQPVVHGDLKSRNVLLTAPWEQGSLPKLMLCDFGLSAVKIDVQNTVGSMVSMATQNNGGGTLNWNAPELFEQDAVATKASDVYAFGMIMYELISRKYPFQGLPESRVLQLVVDKHERPKISEGFLVAYVELMQDCWAQKAADRPAFPEVQRRLQKIVDAHCKKPESKVHHAMSRKEIDWYDSAYTPEI
ncbi:hypothetical protein CYMTET_29000 [Cymbomonas tetramitiformis]|uniref:Protein kinase domain-containing protein n=1 Tax=Cymbomonas tetramitiformis TaxID=36881 RepID=A0AAE0KVC4_9CHLO|nr:hypothetical protein CYMTET_29000 [Cymbomonas tetramitiformis]